MANQTLISPNPRAFVFNWRSLYEYRDLLWLWVRRDFTAKYKQTWLGPLWFVFQSVLTATVFFFLFSRTLKVPTDGTPPILFYLCGLMIWGYVSQCLGSTSMTLIANSGLFRKVYFPRLILPLSYCLSSLMALLMQLLVFLVIYAVAPPKTGMSHYVWYLPLFWGQVIALSLGLGLWVAALTVQYRDFHYVMAFLIQLWLYASPISYPLAVVPTELRWIWDLNPLTVPIEGTRLAFLGVGTVEPRSAVIGTVMTVVVLFSGLYLFQKVERHFVDTI